MTPRRCHFCYADPEGDLQVACEALASCNNCRVDIQMDGLWTGRGYIAIQRLAERFGTADVEIHLARAIERRRQR